MSTPPLDQTDLAQKIAATSEDGVLEIRVSKDVGVPVQVTFRSHGDRMQAFGADVTDALLAAARAQDDLYDYELDPLPGHVLGPHDAVIIEGDPLAPLVERLVWVHHAQRTTEDRRKGDLCQETDLRRHDLLVDRVEGLTIVPAVECSHCGRTGWITDGSFIPIARGLTDRRVTDDRREKQEREHLVS